MKKLPEILDFNRQGGVKNVLHPKFYARPTLEVAKDLVGKLLVVKKHSASAFNAKGAQVTVGRIVETEGYFGEDPASHSARGKTLRCAPMFEKPGNAYIYLIYGMYDMLNFVTEPEGKPGAVLIRAIEPLFGLEWIKKRRRGIPSKNWTNGPGRLTQAIGIRRSQHNRSSLNGPELFVVDDGYRPLALCSSPRVGIREGKEFLWRYYLKDHPMVSSVKENKKGVYLEPTV